MLTSVQIETTTRRRKLRTEIKIYLRHDESKIKFKMSAIGIDFGNASCVVSAFKDGGIETIDNEFGLRATP